MSGRVPAATISVDLDPVDVHLRGYGHMDLPPDPLVHERGLERLLDAFARHGVRATFFVLARDVPSETARLSSIAAAGHEVASHGIDHTPSISRQSESAIGEELMRSRERIEAAVGRPVLGFRAPDWSAGPALVAALDASGYRYDASLVPSPVLAVGRLALAIRARRLRDVAAVRLPSRSSRDAFIWRVGERSIIEFPLAVSPRVRIPIYHTLRPRIGDLAFERHLDGFVDRGESFTYALHGIDALGLVEDGVDGRLGHHPGVGDALDDKLDLIDRTLAAIVARFEMLPFAERLPEPSDPSRVR